MTDDPSRQSGTKPRRRKLRHRVRASVPRLSRFAVEHLLLLPLGVLLALVWVNIEPESYYRATFAIAFAVNDVAIAIFFCVAALMVPAGRRFAFVQGSPDWLLNLIYSRYLLATLVLAAIPSTSIGRTTESPIAASA